MVHTIFCHNLSPSSRTRESLLYRVWSRCCCRLRHLRRRHRRQYSMSFMKTQFIFIPRWTKSLVHSLLLILYFFLSLDVSFVRWIDLTSPKCANNTLIAHAIYTINANVHMQTHAILTAILLSVLTFFATFNLLHIYAMTQYRELLSFILLCHFLRFFSVHCKTDADMQNDTFYTDFNLISYIANKLIIFILCNW